MNDSVDSCIEINVELVGLCLIYSASSLALLVFVSFHLLLQRDTIAPLTYILCFFLILAGLVTLYILTAVHLCNRHNNTNLR